MSTASERIREDVSVTMLIVDDDGNLNNFFCLYFSDMGFNILSETSFASARRLLEINTAIDVVLLDQNLGDGLGYDLLGSINRTPGSRTQVIMVSSNEDEKFIEECFAAGASDYVTKPVNLVLLKLKVEALLDNILLNKKVIAQNYQLEKLLNYAEREKEVARFTFERLLQNNHDAIDGIQLLMQPCTSLSGDFCMCKQAPTGNIFCIIADATGHGLSAAITIMPVATVFGSMVNKGFSLPQIVLEINRKLLNETPADRFVAALVLEVDLMRGEFSVWNGGMPTAYWMSGDGQQLHDFDSRNMALGILSDDMFDANVAVIALPEDGFFFACSDGLLEQKNTQGRAYGKAALQQILGGMPVEQLLKNVLAEVAGHAGKDAFDDVSLCIIDARKMAERRDQEDNRAWLRGLVDVEPFSLRLKLCGQHLIHQELPPLANQYLLNMGLPQRVCKKIFTGIAELVSNAIDHGLLGLNSSMKETEGNFVNYFEARQQRLQHLTHHDFVELYIEFQQDRWCSILQIEVRDSGKGYQLEDALSNGTSLFSGRGLGLISHIFDEIEVLPPGNITRAKLNVIKEPLHGQTHTDC
jgi:serine phosphatase RsbU (regulator of sigma subunit)/anti-sigma regulatory factor (Ser/Thr protein kinase)